MSTMKTLRLSILLVTLAASTAVLADPAQVKALREETRQIRAQIKALKAPADLAKAQAARDKAAAQLAKLQSESLMAPKRVESTVRF
jgi:multidrug resistance efflux pump